MAESRTISIRLDEPDAVRLDELAAQENTTAGILAKRWLVPCIRKGGATDPASMQAQSIAAEVVKKLAEDRESRAAEMKQVTNLLPRRRRTVEHERLVWQG